MAREKKKKLDFTRSEDITIGDLFGLSDGSLSEEEPPAMQTNAKGKAAPQEGSSRVILRKERKGRRGKTVTLLEGLSGTPGQLEETAREMRKDLGCGSHVEGEKVVLQGDQIERAAAWLGKRGFNRVIRGN